MFTRITWLGIVAVSLVFCLLANFNKSPPQEALPQIKGMQMLTDEEIKENIKKDYEYRMLVMEATLFPRLVMDAMVQSLEAKTSR